MKKRRVVLTTASHREAFDEFAEHLHGAERREGWRSSEVLRHFLDAAFRAIRGRTLHPDGDAYAKNEKAYMDLVKRCRHPQETMRDLGAMLGAVTLGLQANPIDFIGPVFSELSSDAGMGQFFTPHELSYTIAKMTFDGPMIEAVIAGDRPYLTCQEPACGVGGMVLAANLVMRERGMDPARQAHWHMTDVDHRAMCGAYIQTALTDTSAVVICGNSLSLEAWETSLTPAAVMFPKSFVAPQIAGQKVTPPPITAPVGQLELF